MEMNFVGVAAALATFFGVWIGHISVRKFERKFANLWIPAGVAIALGSGCMLASFLASDLALSAAGGILGVTLFCDAYEFFHQQQRVRHGHAPANPNNPRHAKILAECPEATTIDWLDRNPQGSKYSSAELASAKEGAK